MRGHTKCLDLARVPTWVQEMKYVYFERSKLTENNAITSVKDKKTIKIKYNLKYMSQKIST